MQWTSRQVRDVPISELTVFAALAMSAATASSFETHIASDGMHSLMGQEQASFGLLTESPAASEERRGLVYQRDPENDEPHEAIVRIEEQIEELATKIESCRKFILAPGSLSQAEDCFWPQCSSVGSGPISGSWPGRSRYCSAALLYGVQTAAPQK
jgi:hypothetical protein